MLLSDRDINASLDSGRIRLDPLDRDLVQPASIDVRLDRLFRLFDNHRYPVIDPAADQSDLTHQVDVGPDQPFVLHPGEFVLGATYALPGDEDRAAVLLRLVFPGRASLRFAGTRLSLSGAARSDAVAHPRALHAHAHRTVT